MIFLWQTKAQDIWLGKRGLHEFQTGEANISANMHSKSQAESKVLR